MSQYNYTKKPNWYDAGDVSASAKGWIHTPTGEVLVAIGNLDTKNTDAAAAPTWTLTLMANGNYVTDDPMVLELVPSENVFVYGTPFIPVTIGATVRNFEYDPATSTPSSLKFNYTVVAGDVDADGITVADTLDVTNGAVYDLVGDSQSLISSAITYSVGTTTGITVN